MKMAIRRAVPYVQGGVLSYLLVLSFILLLPAARAPSFYMITLNARATVGHSGPQLRKTMRR